MQAREGQKVLAVASGGGHWVQLLRLLPAFAGCRLVFVTVDEMYREDVAGQPFHVVVDATRWNRWRLVRLMLQILGHCWRERPDVVVSTGAAPGLFALLFGRLLGAKTIWVDSIANVERLSMSGRLARAVAQLWLTQWPHLARAGGPEFAGRGF